MGLKTTSSAIGQMPRIVMPEFGVRLWRSRPDFAYDLIALFMTTPADTP